MRFDDQVAVITGAGGGLGKQYALLLASRGARVVVNDIGGSVTGAGSNTDAATTAVEEIRQHGGEAIADTHSVTSSEGGQAIIDTALQRLGACRHRDQQCRHRPRCAVRGHHRRSARPADGCTSQGCVLRDEARMEDHARAALRTNPQHLLGRRTPWRRTDEQLRRGEDRVGRPDPGPGRRRRRPRHQSQRGRADRLHPDAGAFGRDCQPARRPVSSGRAG